MKPASFLPPVLAIGLASLIARAETPEALSPAPAPVPAVAAQPAAIAAPAAPAPAKLSPPVREIVKMAASGVSDDIIKAYIDGSSSTFNLTPDAIIHLQGVGVSGAVITAMLAHDKVLIDKASAFPPPNQMPPAQPATAQPAAPYPDTGVPADYGTGPEPNYYYTDYNELSPYGSWYYVGGYGWCWQPYAWLGYYPYPWGLNTFGYGRWWHHPDRGWFWSPNGFRTVHAGFSGSRVIAGAQFRGFNTGQPFAIHHSAGFVPTPGFAPAHGFSTFNRAPTTSGFGTWNHSAGSGWHH